MAPIPELVGRGPYPEAHQRWIRNEVGKWMAECLERAQDNFHFTDPDSARIYAFIIDEECVHPVISSGSGYYTLAGEQFSKIFPTQDWSEHEGKYNFNVEWQPGSTQRYPYYHEGKLELNEDETRLTIDQNKKGIFLLPKDSVQPGYYYLPLECYLPLWKGLKKAAGIK